MLTDIAVKNAKSKEKPYKLTDGRGLFLLVQPNGGKWWRYKYRFGGKEKTLALGTYPDTGLADARERHIQARKALAAGNDPGEVKKEARGRYCSRARPLLNRLPMSGIKTISTHGRTSTPPM